jgi:hypothetical protein
MVKIVRKVHFNEYFIEGIHEYKIYSTWNLYGESLKRGVFRQEVK